MRKVYVEVLKPGMKVAKSVYSSEGLKLIGADTYLTNKMIWRLKLLGIPAVYIDDGLMSDIEVEDIIREEVRVEAVKIVRKSLDPEQTGSKMVINDISIAKTVEEIIDDIIYHDNTVVNMIDIRSYDDYTFAHSVNVCVLAVLTGYSLGYSRSELLKLGMGALLHDIGKIRVSNEILNKPGKLNAEEFEEIKKHTEYGYHILRKQPGLSIVIADTALQHHERFSGTGYPQGLKNNEIHDFAKITGLADVYDALTSDRVYRKAFEPHEAYEMLAGQGNRSFQFSILKTFLDNIAIYPLGTFVRLSTGEVAGVIKVYQGLTQRPVVRVYFDNDGKPISNPYELDLTEKLDLTVESVLKESELQKLEIKANSY